MGLSIVIPCFNEEDIIGKCLTSILNQTAAANEVIIIDNNCSDRSMEIVKQFVGKIPNLKIIKCKEQGIVPSRILGFSKANYELVGTVDADSILDQNWVSTGLSYFQHHPHVMAICGSTYAYSKNIASLIVNLEILHIIWKFFPALRMMPECNGIFKKQAYDKVEGLSPYPNLANKLHLQGIFDDYYLSVKLKEVGQLDFVSQLKVVRRNKDSLKLAFFQLTQYPQIYQFVHRRLPL
ncbi:MAG: glycosyltransferase family 2 protein [bacterium]|nr:glycosyltransferase family 2 protein [bacterium]